VTTHVLLEASAAILAKTDAMHSSLFLVCSTPPSPPPPPPPFPDGGLAPSCSPTPAMRLSESGEFCG
jgi:hypothetical protein